MSSFDRRAIPAEAVETRWSATDGHAIRRIDWSAPSGTARGSLLFVPGRGDFYEKYLETLDYWHRLGWQVTALDWRGQAGSGRLGQDPLTGHVDDFATWVNDFAGFWAEWRAATPGPHVMVGHSMGGHLVMRALAEQRVDPAAAVLVAPMLGFTASLLPMGAMHAASRVISRLGDPRRPAWKWSEKPGEVPESRGALLTHDADRYADELWWRDARPELTMGPGSWGWVERGYASMRLTARADLLGKVEVPVLLLCADNDKLVDPAMIHRAAGLLPLGKLVRFGNEARHELLREVDAVRDKVLAAIDDFLGQAAPRRD